MKIHKLITSSMGYFEFERTTEELVIEEAISPYVDANVKLAKIIANLFDELDLSTEQILKITESRYEELK